MKTIRLTQTDFDLIEKALDYLKSAKRTTEKSKKDFERVRKRIQIQRNILKTKSA